MDAIVKAKPTGAKGKFVEKISVSSSMGPGVKIDLAEVCRRLTFRNPFSGRAQHLKTADGDPSGGFCMQPPARAGAQKLTEIKEMKN